MKRLGYLVLVLTLLLATGLAFAHEHRSWKAKHDFERMTGYPHGRPGWIVDHVIPLACNGADAPINMQWETVAAAKEKDRWERRECRVVHGRLEGCCQ